MPWCQKSAVPQYEPFCSLIINSLSRDFQSYFPVGLLPGHLTRSVDEGTRSVADSIKLNLAWETVLSSDDATANRQQPTPG